MDVRDGAQGRAGIEDDQWSLGANCDSDSSTDELPPPTPAENDRQPPAPSGDDAAQRQRHAVRSLVDLAVRTSDRDLIERLVWKAWAAGGDARELRLYRHGYIVGKRHNGRFTPYSHERRANDDQPGPSGVQQQQQQRDPGRSNVGANGKKAGCRCVCDAAENSGDGEKKRDDVGTRSDDRKDDKRLQ